jgi:transcriptional regulator with XRE-family HTH domain
MLSAVNTFSDWLLEKLRERNWSQSDLSRRAGVSRTAISNLISEKRGPGADLASAIAQALGVSIDEVFHAAGIMKTNLVDDRATRLAHRIAQLPEEDQEVLDAMIDGLFLKRGKKSEPTDLPQDGTAKQT